MVSRRFECGAARIRLTWQQRLFAWEALEDCSSLQTVQAFRAAVPDGALLAALHAGRSKGRDDYPIRVLWGTLLLTIVLRHPTIEACLAELQRNAGLRPTIGADSMRCSCNSGTGRRRARSAGRQRLHSGCSTRLSRFSPNRA
jgi:hypothetical protein